MGVFFFKIQFFTYFGLIFKKNFKNIQITKIFKKTPQIVDFLNYYKIVLIKLCHRV